MPPAEHNEHIISSYNLPLSHNAGGGNDSQGTPKQVLISGERPLVYLTPAASKDLMHATAMQVTLSLPLRTDCKVHIPSSATDSAKKCAGPASDQHFDAVVVLSTVMISITKTHIVFRNC